jgi:hypothetical protein
MTQDTINWLQIKKHEKDHEYSDNGKITILQKYPDAIEKKVGTRSSNQFVISVFSVNNIAVAQLTTTDEWFHRGYDRKKKTLVSLGYIFYENMVKKPDTFDIDSSNRFEQVDLAIKDHHKERISPLNVTVRQNRLLFEIWKLLELVDTDECNRQSSHNIELAQSLIESEIELPDIALRFHNPYEGIQE